MKNELMLKLDLPGDFRKGTIIKRNDDNQWVVRGTNRIFPIPVNVSDFGVFYEDVPVELNIKVGDCITIKKQYLRKYGDNLNENTVLTVVGVESLLKSYVPSIKVNFNNKIIAIDPKHFKIVEIYYFIDSKGNVQRTTKNLDKNADCFRMGIGNYFPSKDDAYKYCIKIIKK